MTTTPPCPPCRRCPRPRLGLGGRRPTATTAGRRADRERSDHRRADATWSATRAAGGRRHVRLRRVHHDGGPAATASRRARRGTCRRSPARPAAGPAGRPHGMHGWHGPHRSHGRRRRRVLGPIVFGALLVWAGLAWLAGVSLETRLAGRPADHRHRVRPRLLRGRQPGADPPGAGGRRRAGRDRGRRHPAARSDRRRSGGRRRASTTRGPLRGEHRRGHAGPVAPSTSTAEDRIGARGQRRHRATWWCWCRTAWPSRWTPRSAPASRGLRRSQQNGVGVSTDQHDDGDAAAAPSSSTSRSASGQIEVHRAVGSRPSPTTHPTPPPPSADRVDRSGRRLARGRRGRRGRCRRR